MIDEMRPTTTFDYANFPRHSSDDIVKPDASSSSPSTTTLVSADVDKHRRPWINIMAAVDDDEADEKDDDCPPPLPPRLPLTRSPVRSAVSADVNCDVGTTNINSTNPFRQPGLVTRSQSLKSPDFAGDLAAMDASHRRRSLKLNCGGGLMTQRATLRTTTVDISASCPSMPSAVSGSVVFNMPSTSSATDADSSCSISVNVRVNVNVDVEPRRYRYPFQPLVLERSASTVDPQRPSTSAASGSTSGLPAAKPKVAATAEDAETIAATQRRLRESGFYYEGVTWLEAIDLLSNRPEGTFLVRDSQDSKFLFSLSVQTKRGPTSVRIHYESGLFYFDAFRGMATVVPRLPCVVALVDHYVAVCESGKLKSHVWVDSSGGTFDQVRLRVPLLHRTPSLKHAARLALNRSAPLGSDLRAVLVKRLPAQMHQFLDEYPNVL